VDTESGTRPSAILYQPRIRPTIGFDVSTSPHELSRAGVEVERVRAQGEMLAVLLCTLIRPRPKPWFMVSELTCQSWLYPRRHLVLWLTAILPPLSYLAWFQTVQRYLHAWPGPLYRRLEYVTLGYVVIAKRTTGVSK
jgi:hypothetical protein